MCMMSVSAIVDNMLFPPFVSLYTADCIYYDHLVSAKTFSVIFDHILLIMLANNHLRYQAIMWACMGNVLDGSVLRHASLGHFMYCLEVMGLNPGWVKPGCMVVLSMPYLNPKYHLPVHRSEGPRMFTSDF